MLTGAAAVPLFSLAYWLLSYLPKSVFGKGKRMLWYLRQWAYPPLHIAPPRHRTATLPSGYRIRVNLSEMTGGDLYWGVPRLDEAERVVFASLLRPGDVVFDVGENIGLYTLTALSVIGPKGEVYAFEPSPISRGLLEQTLAINEIHTVKVEPVGLSDHEGAATLYLNSQSGCTSLGETGRGTVYGVKEIPLMTLDTYVDTRAVHRIDCIKVDVEGFEGDILAGAQKVLREQNPVLFIELDTKNKQKESNTPEKIMTTLGRLGYRMWCISREGGVLERVVPGAPSYPGINFVFAKESNARL